MEYFISVGLAGVKTRVIAHGLGIQGLTKESVGKKDVIIVVPGNPGLIGFYEVFMLKIFKTLKENVNVLGISHAGHDISEKNIYDAPRLVDRPDLYTLHGQIQHKKDFLDEYIPNGSRICFIGHSIGSKVALELMSHLDQTRPNDPKPSGYLLFPTIERMAETPQGQRLRLLLGPFRTPAVYASYMVYFLPEFVKNALVSWYISQPEKEDLISSVGQALKTVVNPNVLEKSLYMANDELAVVRELDVEPLIRHGDRIRAYYGTSDHWCPVEYHKNIVQSVPGLKAQLCQKGYEHAFVLKTSEEMAEQVCAWLKEDFSDLFL